MVAHKVCVCAWGAGKAEEEVRRAKDPCRVWGPGERDGTGGVVCEGNEDCVETFLFWLMNKVGEEGHERGVEGVVSCWGV